MPANRNALLRYRTIDRCLQNRQRKWTLVDLMEACSDALYEYEGRDDGISKRTIQSDLQMMRSNKLGYNAPIIVESKKYYTYAEADYSITNIPLSETDLGKLDEVVNILKQFKGFNHFQELSGMVEKLEEKIQTSRAQSPPIIDFEKNENLKGLIWIDPIYQTIKKGFQLQLEYQSFKARHPQEILLEPYFMKEFRNRWFVLGYRKKPKTWLTIALDRILSLVVVEKRFRKEKNKTPDQYFKNVIGATVQLGQAAEEIKLQVRHAAAPYILTKPLHPSQTLVEKNNLGIIISIMVQHNFELEKEILSFGEQVIVLQPTRLRRSVEMRLQEAKENYDHLLHESNLNKTQKRFQKNGFVLLPHLFRRKPLKLVFSFLNKEVSDLSKKSLFPTTDRHLPTLLLNDKVNSILKRIGINYSSFQIEFYPKQIAPTAENWSQVKVQQSKKMVVSLWLALSSANSQIGCFHVLPGSHKKRLSAKIIKTIGEYSNPQILAINQGETLLLDPLLLRRWARSQKQASSSWLCIHFFKET